MKFLKLYKKQNGFLTTIPFSKNTPVQIFSNVDLNTFYYINLSYEKDEKTITKTIDLSLLMSETKLGKLKTWQEIIDNLTEVQIESYSSAYLDVDNPVKYVDQISITNSLNMDIHYTQVDSPGTRDIPSMLWKMTDMCISQKEKKLNFNNCICSVNGLISKPIVFNDEMYIRDAMTYLTHDNTYRWPDVIMLDFNPIGNIQIVPFSDCKHNILQEEHINYAGSDVEVILPEDISLNNKTVLAVIGHTLILHNRLFVVNDRTVHLQPYTYPLQNSLLHKHQMQSKYVKNTEIVRTEDVNLRNYIYKDMFNKDHNGAFFIIVDTPNMYITESTVFEEVDKFTLRTHDNLGILRQRSNWGVIDYVYDKYKNMTILTINEPTHSILFDNKFDEELVSTDVFNCRHNRHQEKYPDAYYTTYEMFRLIA